MKERYGCELPRWMKLLGVRRINKKSIDFKWGYFAPRPGLKFILHRGGYFDQRWGVTLSFIYGVFHFYLPFKTKLSEGCDPPQYGIGVHSNTLWLYTGGEYDESIGQCTGKRWMTWDLPFFSYVFRGHWIKDKSLNWTLVDGGVGSYEFRRSGGYVETHPYRYTLRNGTVQERTATCTIEKREWHRKWFPFLKKRSEVIDIEFSDEVGERTGSWKGGTIGCSHELKPNETILESLRRMEAERKF